MLCKLLVRAETRGCRPTIGDENQLWPNYELHVLGQKLPSNSRYIIGIDWQTACEKYDQPKTLFGENQSTDVLSEFFSHREWRWTTGYTKKQDHQWGRPQIHDSVTIHSRNEIRYRGPLPSFDPSDAQCVWVQCFFAVPEVTIKTTREILDIWHARFCA